MPRKEIKHERIESDSKRNKVFTQRLEGLFKKFDELSTLCSVDICAIIKKPTENQTFLWPSPQVFSKRLHDFYSLSDLERNKNMVDHETYLKQKIRDEQNLVLKLQKRNEEKEFDVVMNDLYVQGKNLNDLDMDQLSLLRSSAGEMLAKLRKRKEELDLDERYKQPMPLSPPLYGAPVGGYDHRYKQPSAISLPQPGTPVGVSAQRYKQPLLLSLPTPGAPFGGYEQSYPQPLSSSLPLPRATVIVHNQRYKQPLPPSLPPLGAPVGGYDQRCQEPPPLSIPLPRAPVGVYDQRCKQPLPISLSPHRLPVGDYDQRCVQSSPISLPPPVAPVGDYGATETLVCENSSTNQWFMEP